MARSSPSEHLDGTSLGDRSPTPRRVLRSTQPSGPASLRGSAGHETAFRAGGGIFYDSIEIVNFFGNGDALGSQSIYKYTPQFPLQANQLLVPVVAPTAPYSFVDYPAHNIVPPHTIQWNAALDQSLGAAQSLRHTFSAAAVYNLTSNYGNPFEKAILAHWNADVWFTARSAFSL